LVQQVAQYAVGFEQSEVRFIAVILLANGRVTDHVIHNLVSHHGKRAAEKLIDRAARIKTPAAPNDHQQADRPQDVERVGMTHHTRSNRQSRSDEVARPLARFGDFVKVIAEQDKDHDDAFIAHHAAALDEVRVSGDHQHGNQATWPAEESPAYEVKND